VASTLSEWQRVWARAATYAAVNDIVRDHFGAWGQGVNFVRAMIEPSLHSRLHCAELRAIRLSSRRGWHRERRADCRRSTA
jgi:hypothetical protein